MHTTKTRWVTVPVLYPRIHLKHVPPSGEHTENTVSALLAKIDYSLSAAELGSSGRLWMYEIYKRRLFGLGSE